MEHSILSDFKGFLSEYRKSWNSCDNERMSRHSSKELKVRWPGKDAKINDWGYDNSAIGWKQAFNMYKGRNPKWFFEDILTVINQQKEGVAVFWVTFEVDGNLTNNKMLFVETFRKENDEWKKIREYVENSFANES
ncbi:hypothetical protein JOD43_001028 [Pullulanibacillus pueri]|uniref:DUF4440 domain-containing protein n=1 Tax=Pullulanibacillus pueri TaxID=1437324 RepID=A0A8J2ZW70_9BACL|nr:hypothetical protein [Pullulanibacillus pueri]MBM7680862.1 hypothetical protein [Pullulanibacillus pueri]GGH81127.1 hypothetical protein GCM10007096_18550 [Pullulanibacillus pueri]